MTEAARLVLDRQVRRRVEELLNDAWGTPVALDGVERIWGRDHVLRVTARDGRSAVVKRPRAGGSAGEEGTRQFRVECASLRFLSGMRETVAPKLLGADAEAGVMVIEDLPAGRSLADSLLLGDRAAVGTDLVAYARALATVHCWSITRIDELEQTLALAGPGALDDPWWLRLTRSSTPALSAFGTEAGVAAGQGAAEVGDVLEHLHGAAFRGLIHTDPCPDNVRVVDGSCRIFDYEAAAVGSVAIDAAFLVAPMPSCWCFGRLPPELSAAALDAYWATMRIHGLEEDDEWRLSSAAALASFLASRADRLDRFLDPDNEWGTTGGAARMLAWTTAAIAAAEAVDAWPGLRAVFELVRHRAREADPGAEVPDYPALATGPVSVKTPDWWRPGY